MKYRAEIDGLRALAVLPVILFHAGLPPFSGGFLGVDVFFVISGFLITSILLSDLEQDRFSLLTFYERRTRRILPALFCVILCCVPFAWSTMDPTQYEAFSKSMLATLAFVSNLYFWQSSDYFGDAAEEMPLLHTWSLAIEEQYYVFFPLLLWVIWRLSNRHIALGLIILCGLLSLAVCEYASFHHPAANFFLLPMRAWELCAGATCAFVAAKVKPNNLLAIVGILAILASYLYFDDASRLPSLYSIIPVLGTCLILLFAKQGTLAARLLSLSPLVGIGLISYSAYLWHQPIFAFVRIGTFSGISTEMWLLLCAATLLLAYVSWRFVEQPFRKRGADAPVNNKALIASMAGLALLIAALGAHGVISDGRFEQWKASISPNQYRAYELLSEAHANQSLNDNGACRFGNSSLSTDFAARVKRCFQKHDKGVLLIGDSHMMDLVMLFEHGSSETDYPFVAALVNMCRPFQALGEQCQFYSQAKEYLQTHDHFSQVIYAQGGFYLIQSPEGRGVGRANLQLKPLDFNFEHYTPHTERIDAVKAYLMSLSEHSHVTWLGSRVEPSFDRKTLTRLGCDYEFAMRPNHQTLYSQIDDAIQTSLSGSDIQFKSQVKLIDFDMKKDFMNCDITYWSDGDHFSSEGELRFSKRLNLHHLIPPQSP